MNWQGQNFPSDRVQDLLEAFNCFIEDNHKGNKDEDVFIRDQWQKLKKIIEQSPFDTAAHQQYVQRLKFDGLQIDARLTKSVNGAFLSPSHKKNPAKKYIPSKQLQKISSKLVEKIKQNNKNYLK